MKRLFFRLPDLAIACALLAGVAAHAQPVISDARGVYAESNFPNTRGVDAGVSFFEIDVSASGLVAQSDGPSTGSRLEWIPSNGICPFNTCTFNPDFIDVESGAAAFSIFAFTEGGAPAPDPGARIRIINPGSIVSVPFPFPLNPFPAAVSSLPGGFFGVPYTARLSTGGTPAVAAPFYEVSLLTGTLPPGLTLSSNPGGGILTGTPTQVGTFTFSVFVSDGWDRVFASFRPAFQTSYTVVIQYAPLVVPNSVLPPGQVLVNYSALLPTSGGSGVLSSATVTSGSLPPGFQLSISGRNVVIGGVTLLAGVYTAGIRVTDPNAGSATGTVTITIVPAATPPIQFTTASPLPAATVTVPYVALISAIGGNGALQYTQVSGALPPGLSLSIGGAVGGTPTQPGSFSFTVRAADRDGNNATATYSLLVNVAPLVITTATPLSDGVTGAKISVTFQAIGGVPPYAWGLSAGDPPAGFTLSAAGVFSGSTDTPGTYNFTVQVNDSAKTTAVKRFTLKINPPPLTITTTALPDGLLGSAYSGGAAATGGVKPYKWSASGLPAGLSIDPASAAITGVPTADGTFNVVLQVTDSAAASATQTVALKIAVPALIITTASPLADGVVGVAYSAGFGASGGIPPYTFAVSSGSLPGSFTLAANGALSGTPDATGSFSFTIQATDARKSTAVKAFTLRVAPAPLAVTTSSLPSGTTGAAYSASVAASGGVPPYTWSGSLPAGLTIAPATGAITGTTTASGSVAISVTVTDSTRATATRAFNVQFNLPPVPAITFGGVNDTANARTQPTLQLALSNPYPVALTGTVTLTFRADTGGDDPAIQFSSGGRTATFTVPPNTTTIPNLSFQTGTVAGVITLTLSLTAGGTNVTPSPAPSRQIRIPGAVPSVLTVTATRNATGFTVVATGFSTTRDLTQALFHFNAAAGATLQTTDLTLPVTPIFSAWFQSADGTALGSQFQFTQPFTVQGNQLAVASVTVTLVNSQGNSQTASANIQ